MNRFLHIIKILTVATALAAGLALVGCGSNAASSASSASASSASSAASSASASASSESAASSEASSASASASAEVKTLVVGDQTDSAVNIVFENRLKVPITNIAMMSVDSGDEPAFLMAEGQQVENGEKVSVFVEPVENMLYNVVLQCGEARYWLHDVNPSLYAAATLDLEGNIAYLRTTIDGNEVSSLRDEAARAQAAEEAAANEGQVETQNNSGEYYEEVYYDDSANYDAPAQGGDSCVSDVVLN